MDITDEGAVEKGFAGLSRVAHGLLAAGTIRDGPMDTMTSRRHMR
jgi:hypothetical protein